MLFIIPSSIRFPILLQFPAVSYYRSTISDPPVHETPFPISFVLPDFTLQALLQEIMTTRVITDSLCRMGSRTRDA